MLVTMTSSLSAIVYGETAGQDDGTINQEEVPAVIEDEENGWSYDVENKTMTIYTEHLTSKSFLHASDLIKLCETLIIESDMSYDSLSNFSVFGNVKNLILNGTISCTSNSKNIRVNSSFKKLESVYFNASQKTIPYCFFCNCSKLSNIDWPEDLECIEEYAFYGYKGETITVPDSVQVIGMHCFENSVELIEVKLPDSIESLPYCCFYGCTKLKKITLPQNLKKIDSESFYNCKSLSDIVLPDGLESIGQGAFYENRLLKELVIPDTVSEIGANAFKRCVSLCEITVPKSVKVLGEKAFYYCDNLEKVSLVAEIDEIPDWCFYYCTKLKNVVISETVSVIGNHAFSNCEVLEKVELPENVVTIGADAFFKCVGLSELHLNEGLKSIGSHAFSHCASLKEFIIPEGVNVIGDSCLADCINLDTAYIPDSVDIIGRSVFLYCGKLKNVRMPEKVAEMGNGCFSSCSSLERITYPQGITRISGNEFNGCKNLRILYLPDGLKEISYYFGNLTELELVVIPESVDTVSASLFTGNNKTTIVYKGTEETWNSLFGDEKQNVVFHSGHCALEIEDSVEPDCTNDGFSIGVSCKECGEEVLEKTVIKRNGHSWSVIESEEYPTCAGEGHTESYKCAICDEVKPSEIIPALEHDMADWSIVTEATCESRGLEQRECYACSFIEYKRTPELGHDLKKMIDKASLKNFGSISKICKNCYYEAERINIPPASNIKLSKTEYVYTGRNVALPTVKVKDSTGKKLVKGVDYTVTYEKDHKSIGKHKVTVKGKGNYKYTKNVYYTIIPKTTSIKSVSRVKDSIKLKLRVKYKKGMTGISGYEIKCYYAGGKACGQKAAVSGRSNTTAIVNGYGGCYNYVIIRSYKTVNGKKYYSKWSKPFKKKMN